MTPSAKFRSRLKFQERAVLPDGDGAGNFVGDWEDRFTLAARVLPIASKGDETVLAARLTGVQPMTVIVRSTASTRRITAAWRAIDAVTGTEYALTSPPSDPDGTCAYLAFTATLGVAA